MPSRKSRDANEPPLEQFPIPPALVEHILLGPADDRRVLQDSPILADVWLAYAADPASLQDLLITPHMEATSATVASQISEGLKRIERSDDREKRAKVAYLQGIVAAKLYFDEVLRILVPMTQWWTQGGNASRLAQEDHPEAIKSRIKELLHPASFVDKRAQLRSAKNPTVENFSALDRYIALAGLILWVGGLPRPVDKRLQPIKVEEVFQKFASSTDEIFDGLIKLYLNVVADGKAPRDEAGGGETPEDQNASSQAIFQISLNRHASPALEKSVSSVKADAAHTLFNVKCDKIVWAVIDSGIDGGHDAFITSEEDTQSRKSRVRKTFDFTNIREIISSDNDEIEDARLEELLSEAGVCLGLREAREGLKIIANDASRKRPIDWDVVEELISASELRIPVSAHGTHVAGIIGADQNGNGKKSLYAGGMCPDIRLYDFRVLAKTVEDTEFAVIAALQYIRYVNERHNFITIHGANLSLSIPHNVRNFACGRTPVCNECERLVNSGVVVVAAAGNRGYQNFETKDGSFESYAAFSITDPGNADGVITVGATHGNWPHTYGVSFFSSRGPTGDGRLKPDLVAPGERIQSTVLNKDWGPESGTSMATPHVSGAAAMLLARYSELIGQPRRVKSILCENATDLGRERSFQGHGMLDVLRAFQSI